jgi:hypothetical protein
MNAHAAKQMTDYLRSLDPADFRDAAALAGLILRCQNAGVDRRDFVSWAQGGKRVSVAWHRIQEQLRCHSGDASNRRS